LVARLVARQLGRHDSHGKKQNDDNPVGSLSRLVRQPLQAALPPCSHRFFGKIVGCLLSGFRSELHIYLVGAFYTHGSVCCRYS